MKYFRKEWVLYQEVANEGGAKPNELLAIKINEGDAETNKHIPFIKEVENGYFVKVGKNDYHATDAEHHTMFIELYVDKKYVYKQYISIDEKGEALFEVPKGKVVEALAFCNLHGMFKNSL